ncbi:MAG: hypothetical protein NVS4B1_07950 [Ktedonobacteraceae bacterium]
MQAYQIHATALAGCTALISLAASYLDAPIPQSKYEVLPAAPDSPGRAKCLSPYPLSRRSRRQ